VPDQLPGGENWLWLGGSLLLAILWTNASWLFRQPRSIPGGESIARIAASQYAPWLLHLVRLLYYVGLPAAAFLLGQDAIIRRYLGLQVDQADPWRDWAYDVGWAAALGFGTLALLALGWWTYRRAVIAATGEPHTITGWETSGWAQLREAAFHEIHWTFYRNLPVVLLRPDAYWGAWIGLLLVGLEAALNPSWRAALGDPSKALPQLTRSALAVSSCLLFLLTPNGNLWLAIVAHWGVSWAMTALAGVHRPEPVTAYTP